MRSNLVPKWSLTSSTTQSIRHCDVFVRVDLSLSYLCGSWSLWFFCRLFLIFLFQIDLGVQVSSEFDFLVIQFLSFLFRSTSMSKHQVRFIIFWINSLYFAPDRPGSSSVSLLNLIRDEKMRWVWSLHRIISIFSSKLIWLFKRQVSNSSMEVDLE